MKNRQQDSVQSILNKKSQSTDLESLILSSPTDIGVRRNLGRNGARFGPQAIMNQFLKLNNHLPYDSINLEEVSETIQELEDFAKAQVNGANKIAAALSKFTNDKIIHIGGGHDHIYPLLMGIDKSQKYKNIFILNIDAHCDTRTDNESHSGTPFRDYDVNGSLPFHLVQYGIDHSTNSKSTLTPLNRGSERHFFINDIVRNTEHYLSNSDLVVEHCPFTIDKDSALIISIDADGIAGSEMPGVSAVNGHGIPLQHVFDLTQKLLHFRAKNHFLGIYEYNPVFDSLSGTGARSLARLMYDFLN